MIQGGNDRIILLRCNRGGCVPGPLVSETVGGELKAEMYGVSKITTLSR